MPTRLAPLLSLLGHELRAPTGVVGGYLALLEQSRDSLTPAQQKALLGARRAQQSLVEGLDDLRRLTSTLRPDDEPLAWSPIAALAQEVGRIAAVRGVPLALDIRDAMDVPRRGPESALADALVIVGEAVAREHGADVVASTAVRGRALVWRVRPAGVPDDTAATRHDFHLWRAGLGVRLVWAAIVLERAHATLEDLRIGEARHGVDVTFDLDAASAPPPRPFGAA